MITLTVEIPDEFEKTLCDFVLSVGGKIINKSVTEKPNNPASVAEIEKSLQQAKDGTVVKLIEFT